MYTKERRVIRMDFGTWSPSHTILVLVVLVAFIGQVAVYFYRTAQNDKKIERLEERMDKRFVEHLDNKSANLDVEVKSPMCEVKSPSCEVKSPSCEVRSPMCEVGSPMCEGKSAMSDWR